MRADADRTLPVNQVRLLIADTDDANRVLDDRDIEGYLALEDGSVKRAAAAALDAIAVSEVLISKVIRTGDLSTDGAKVAASLQARAVRLRAEADDEDEVFDVIAFDPYGSC